MKKIVNSISEAGTLMVEALAMLGLISMVTPVLYKKAAERTVELQDINASGQMRAVSSALDSFLKDNYTTITSGGKVTVSGGEEIDFVGYKNATNHVESFSGENFVKALSPYLPYGFADDGGNIRETKLFNDYDFAIAMNGVNASGNKINRTLTGFMVAKPKNNTTEVTPMRAARIASMIGSNGGYVDDSDTARGTQGIWSVKMSDDLDIDNAPENAIVVSSLQPVSAQSLDEELLHRVDKLTDVNDRLNTMETDLFMGTDSETGIKGHNIRMVNQIIMRPNEDYMVGEDGQSVFDGDNKGEPHSDVDEDYEQDKKNALYIADGGGANISGVLNAVKEHFRVDDDGIQYFGDHSEEDPEHPGVTNQVIDSSPLFSVNDTRLTYGTEGVNKAFLNIDRGENSLSYSTKAKIGVGPYATDVDKNILYAGPTKIKLGDSILSERIDKHMMGVTQMNWKTVIGERVEENQMHTGTYTVYDWSGNFPTEQGELTNKYTLSVNGSAFVKDTLLTGKIKTFNGDFATLRAGVDPDEFNDADDDDFFMKVESFPSNGGTYSRFRVGSLNDNEAATDTILRVTKGNEPTYGQPGVLVSTGTKNNNGGINILAGTLQAPVIDANHDVIDWANDGKDGGEPSGFSQDGIIKMYGTNGIYLGTDGEAPVAINNDMYRAYRSESGGDIWSITDINSDEYYVRPSYDHDNQDGRIGDYVIQDMITTVSASPENSGLVFNEYNVFKVNPTMSDDNLLLGGGTMPYSANDTDDQPRAIEMTGSVAVYDYDRYSSGLTGAQFPSFTVDKGQVAIRATQDVPSRQIEKGDRILVVDNDSSSNDGSAISDGSSHPDQRGSVYIRKGSINLAPAQPVGKTVRRAKESDLKYDTGVTPQGYIAADRFVTHNSDANYMLYLSKGASKFGNLKTNSTSYDRYEVNPAYTSVMHDIKLTTRGGARLSDILPDFINKGIYVVNSTYNEDTQWTSNGFNPISWAKNETNEINSGNASAFLGFIPTPKCPPRYAKVVTLMPASWAMAQAGKVYPIEGGKYDVAQNNIPADTYSAEDQSMYTLNFQKSTWLKSMVMPYNWSGDFKGWSAIMGFIYPKSLWDAGGEDDGSVYWNLFPVKYKELEGYATVYCYFDRKQFTGSIGATGYVDSAYDTLADSKAHESVVSSTKKGTNRSTSDANASKAYLKRLDDPALKYESPW